MSIFFHRANPVPINYHRSHRDNSPNYLPVMRTTDVLWAVGRKEYVPGRPAERPGRVLGAALCSCTGVTFDPADPPTSTPRPERVISAR